MNNIRQVIDYFWLISLSHPGLKDFSLYDDDVKLQRIRSTVKYPVLELEFPQAQIRTNSAGNARKVYNVRLSVLAHSEKDDWQRQQEILSTTESIVDNIVSKLLELDLIAPPVDGSQSYNMYPITNHQGDNLYGWGLEVSTEAPLEICPEETWIYAALARPEWVDGAEVLSIDAGGTVYSAAWTSEDDPAPLQQLADAITEGGDATADVMAGTLNIYSSTPGFELDTVEDAHSWNFYQLPTAP